MELENEKVRSENYYRIGNDELSKKLMGLAAIHAKL